MNDSIFGPHYNITPVTTSVLDNIEGRRWLVENMLLMPKHEAWLRREVAVRRAAGTTAIEGAGLDEAAVGRLVSRGHTGRLTEDQQANLNAIQAYEFIDFLSDQPDIPIDELAVRQLNRYLMSGSPETLTPGVYRKGENKVGDFIPPNQGDVPGLMRSFALWLRQDEDIHPVIKAGLAHVHLVAIHPFWDGNGRTARGLATLILQRSPFGFRKLLTLESTMFDIRDDYFTAIERTVGARYSPGYDATPWLEFFTLTLNAHVDQLTATLTDWHRMMQELHDMGVGKGLLPRQVDGHVFAVQTGSITRSEYMEITGVSPVTASRDLARLVELGLLAAEGKTRSRIYKRASPSRKTSDGQPSNQPHLFQGDGG